MQKVKTGNSSALLILLELRTERSTLDCLGGGGTRALAPSHRPAGEFNLPNMAGVCLGRSLIEMAAKGNVEIPLNP